MTRAAKRSPKRDAQVTIPLGPVDLRWKISQMLQPHTDERLIFSADYGEVGADDNRFASYALIPLFRQTEVMLDATLNSVLRRRLGNQDPASIEIHTLTIWHKDPRAKSAFATLATIKSMRSFLLDIAAAVGRTIPFSVVAVEKVYADQKNSKDVRRQRAKRLISTSQNAMGNMTLAAWNLNLGRTTIYIDEGDSFDLGLPAADYLAVAESQLLPLSEPTFVYEKSASRRLIQVADLVAFAGGRLMAAHEALIEAKTNASSTETILKKRSDLTFFVNLCERLNLEVICTAELIPGRIHPHTLRNDPLQQIVDLGGYADFAEQWVRSSRIRGRNRGHGFISDFADYRTGEMW